MIPIPSQSLTRFARHGSFALGTAVAILHAAAVWVAIFAFGVDIAAQPGRDTFDRVWQLIPTPLLETDFLASVMNFHAQPPFFSVLIGGLAKWRPESAIRLFHILNVILGCALSGMMFLILLRLTGRRSLSFLAALALALNPAIILFEAYLLYDLLSAFLVVLVVWSVAMYRPGGRVLPLHLFLAVVGLLTMTRSFYHPLLLCPAVALAVSLAQEKRRQLLVTGLLVSFLVFGWATKNRLEFGFWGTSSWYGLNFWRAASSQYSRDELKALGEQGIIHTAPATLDPFAAPFAFRRYGYDRTSDKSILASGMFNNINVPAVSALFFRNSLELIWHNPATYVRGVWRGYLQYCEASVTFPHVSVNARSLGLTALDLRWHRLAMATLLPLSLLVYAILTRRRWRHPADAAWTVDEVTLRVTAFAISYTTIFGSLLEFGENVRFRFMVEQLIWAFWLGILTRCTVHWLSRRS